MCMYRSTINANLSALLPNYLISCNISKIYYNTAGKVNRLLGYSFVYLLIYSFHCNLTSVIRFQAQLTVTTTLLTGAIFIQNPLNSQPTYMDMIRLQYLSNDTIVVICVNPHRVHTSSPVLSL